MNSPGRRAALPATVWVLGLVSLFMDISSEMIHALMPVFVVGTLGAGAIWLGLIEGVAEGTACIVKVFSGALSDRWGRRKSLALLGYGMAAVSKPLFPLAGSTATVFLARFVDRIGKGIRGAPRDALIADCTTPGQRGRRTVCGNRSIPSARS
jgi:MFS family permease